MIPSIDGGSTGTQAISAPSTSPAQPAVASADPTGPSAAQTLDALQRMLPPDLDPNYRSVFGAIPEALFPQAILRAELIYHYTHRAELADAAIGNAPERSDFEHLPASERDAAFASALSTFDQDTRPGLEAIYLDARYQSLLLDPGYAALPEATRATFASEIGQRAPGDQEAEILVTLAGSPGFQALGEHDQDTLLRLALTDTYQLGGFLPGSNNLQLLALTTQMYGVSDSGVIGRPDQPVDDAQALLDFIDAKPSDLSRVDAKVAPVNEVTISEPSAPFVHAFGIGPAVAVRYTLGVGDATTVVTLPAAEHPDLHLPSIERIARALGALPPESLGLIRTITVQPHIGLPSGDGGQAHMAIYGDTGEMFIYATQEPTGFRNFTGTMVHESGHVFDATRTGALDDWRWSLAATLDRVDASAYARSSPAEDFAETYALYMAVRGTADEAETRALLPNRFALLDALVADA